MGRPSGVWRASFSILPAQGQAEKCILEHRQGREALWSSGPCCKSWSNGLPQIPYITFRDAIYQNPAEKNPSPWLAPHSSKAQPEPLRNRSAAAGPGTATEAFVAAYATCPRCRPRARSAAPLPNGRPTDAWQAQSSGWTTRREPRRRLPPPPHAARAADEGDSRVTYNFLRTLTAE